MCNPVRDRFLPLILITLFLMAAPAIFAQATYEDIVSKAKGGDANVDFKAMRMAFTQTQHFLTGIDPKLRAKLADSLKAKKPDEIGKAAQEILKTDFVNPNVHMLAAQAYQALKDAKKAQFHTEMYVGLVNSIIKESDGESTKTPYVVISEDEITAVMAALELQRTAQASMEEAGHRFTVITATDRASNSSSKVYFNIDKIPAKASETPKQ